MLKDTKVGDILILSVSEIIGKNSAILHSDGLKLYQILKENVEKRKMRLSFKGILYCTTAFLNASVGKLLVEHPGLTNSLDYNDVNDNAINEKIRLVIENVEDAKRRDTLDSSSRNIFEQ